MGSETQKSRSSFLQRFLGKEEAEAVDTSLQTMQAALSKAGIATKSIDVDKAKGFLESLVADIAKPLSKITDDQDKVQEIANEAAAMALGRLLNMSEEMPEETVEEEPLEMAADDEEETEDERFMELSKAVTDLAAESTRVNKELQELIPAFVEMAKVVQQLTPLVEKAQEVDKLKAKIKNFESVLSLTPRAASQATETLLENDEIKAILNKSAKAPTETILGLEVNSEVN